MIIKVFTFSLYQLFGSNVLSQNGDTTPATFHRQIVETGAAK